MRTRTSIEDQSTGRLVVLILLAAFLAADVGWAAERFQIRIFGVRQSAAGDEIRLAGVLPADDARFRLSDGTAVGVELEYRWRPKIAFELMAHFGDYDAEFGPAVGATEPVSRGSLGSETYTLGINWLLASLGRAELTAGAFGGFSYYDDITLAQPATGRPETFRFDDDLGFGVKLGIDLPLSADGRWLVTGALRYQSSILEGEVAGRDMDVDPVSLTLGAGYRF